MNFTLRLNNITTLDAIPGYWTDDDFIHILKDLEVSDAQSASPAELRELIKMALADFEATAKATRVEFELRWKDGTKEILNKELAIKALSRGLTETSPVLRLFQDQLDGKEPFADAEHLVWELQDSGSNQYALITSDYWIGEEDFPEREFSNTLHLCDREED